MPTQERPQDHDAVRDAGEKVPPATDPNAPSPEAADVPRDGQQRSVDDELATLTADLEQAEKRMLMAQAELENFRKRMRREMEDERRFASLPLIRDLLAVVDNLDRAIEAAETNQDAGGLLEGVKMVAAQLHSVLDNHHCRPVDALGQEFDPNQHEAIAQQPSEEYPAGRVAQVYRRGYWLHDRVVRPAQVIVSTGPAAKE